MTIRDELPPPPPPPPPRFEVEERVGRQIEHAFVSHALNKEQAASVAAIRAHALYLARLIASQTPPGRERASALTKLEEAVFWTNAGIAREQP